MTKESCEIESNWLAYFGKKDFCVEFLSQLESSVKIQQNVNILLLTFVAFEAGDVHRFKNLMNDIQLEGFNSNLEIAKYYILKAIDLHYGGDSKNSLVHLDLGKNKLQSIGTEEEKLLLDYLKYLESLCYHALGRHYLSLDNFQLITANNKCHPLLQASSATNMGFIFLMFGLTLNIRRIFPKILPEYQDYFKLYLEQSKGDMQFANQCMMNGVPSVIAPGNQFIFQERLFLSLWILGSEETINFFKKSESFKFMKKTNFPYSFCEKMNQLGLALLGEFDRGKALLIEEDECWAEHSKLWFHFKKMLLIAEMKEEVEVKNYISENIQNICTKNYLTDPIFPYISNDKWYPESKWSIALSEKLGFSASKNINLCKQLLRIYDRQVIFESNDSQISLDFSTRPKSLKALQILAGPKGHKVSKKYLHEQLTSNVYNSYLHDDRLYQLYGRIQKQFREANLPEILSFNRDHFVTILLEISLQ